MEILIQNDLFDIADRLKEINEHYEVYFDTERQKFVVKAFGLHQFTVPYDKLDVRTLDYAYYTRRENAEAILHDVDVYNERRERDDLRKVKDEVEDEYSRRLRLSSRYGRENDA